MQTIQTMLRDVLETVIAPFAMLGCILVLILLSPVMWYLNARERSHA